jgi:CubicO group peptidase (beta-lactamase class C family)
MAARLERSHWLLIAIALVGAGMAGCPTARPGGEHATELLERLVQALNTGDQATFQNFAEANYAPAALNEDDAVNRAAALARIYTDAGGFTDVRTVSQVPTRVQADARARITDIEYCLSLDLLKAEGRDVVMNFTAREMFPASPSLRTPSPHEVQKAVDALASKYAVRGLFSGVILIAYNDNVILRRAYGDARISPRRPMTVDTRLSIASIGKMFTGVGVAQLVDAGKLSYDDTIGKVWPEYPDRDVREHVTIRQLLTHTSGMGPDDYYDHPRYKELLPTLRSVPDYMKLVVGTSRGGKPGEYQYSNSGYILLGAAIERLSGQSYYDYVRDHIFEPAKMSRSVYAMWDEPAPDIARPLTNFFTRNETAYVYRLGPFNPVVESPPRGGPQGGAHVTADDLLSFATALRSGKLVSPARFNEMTTPRSPSGAGAGGLLGDVREGLGVEVVKRNGHTFFGHTGGDFGVASLLYWYPDTGYTTILLSNRDPRAARVLANFTRALITRESMNGADPPVQECQGAERR